MVAGRDGVQVFGRRRPLRPESRPRCSSASTISMVRAWMVLWGSPSTSLEEPAVRPAGGHRIAQPGVSPEPPPWASRGKKPSKSTVTSRPFPPPAPPPPAPLTLGSHGPPRFSGKRKVSRHGTLPEDNRSAAGPVRAQSTTSATPTVIRPTAANLAAVTGRRRECAPTPPRELPRLHASRFRGRNRPAPRRAPRADCPARTAPAAISASSSSHPLPRKPPSVRRSPRTPEHGQGAQRHAAIQHQVVQMRRPGRKRLLVEQQGRPLTR